MSKNIFQIWMDNGKRVPFAVRRDNWSERFWAVVEEVRVRRWPYGEAYGYPVADGVPNDHFDYDEGWRTSRIIPNAGSYQWTLVQVGLEGKVQEGTKPPKPPKLLGLDSPIGFGKYRTSRLADVLLNDPGYVGWMLRTVETVAIDPEVFAGIPEDERAKIGADALQANEARCGRRERH